MTIEKDRLNSLQVMINEVMSDHAEIVESVEILRKRYASMRSERDEIQNRLQAIDHAYKNSQEVCRISGEEIRRLKNQLSCAFTINNRMKAVQWAVCDWIVPEGIRARTAMERILPMIDDKVIVEAQNGLLCQKPE